MLKKTFTIMILAVLFLTAFQTQPTQAKTDKDVQLIEKTRSKVQEIGTGNKNRVKVKLRNKTELKGYISGISSDSFTVTDSETGMTQTLSYDEVQQVKKSGGISKLKWGIIAGVAAAAVIVGTTVLYPVLCDGGAGC